MNEAVTAKRIVFTAPGVAGLEERQLSPLADDQVLIRTSVSLISPGTERAWFLGLPNTPGTYPQGAGYSNIGTIVRCGPAVEHLTPGQRVATPAPHASYVVQRAEKCTPVPATVKDDHAAFFNLTSIVLQGVRKSRLELGESTIVIGAGLIGLLALQVARCSGAMPLLSVEREAGRRKIAAQISADAALAPDADLGQAITTHCGTPGAAVVVEATGHPEAIPMAFSLAQPGGRVVLLGSTRGETAQVNFYRDVHCKGITVIGAHNQARPAHDSRPGWWTQPDDWRLALRLLDRDKVDVDPLITHTFDWRDAATAYTLLKEWKLDALGIVLQWNT